MKWLTAEWAQRGLDALRETFDVSTEMKVDMVRFLLDEGFWDAERMSFDSAMARFNACLNPHKPEYFKPGELWALMKRFRRHQFFAAQSDDLGYESRLRATEERLQQLVERLATATERATEELAAARADLARLQGEGAGARVHPSIRAGSPAFSKDPGPGSW